MVFSRECHQTVPAESNTFWKLRHLPQTHHTHNIRPAGVSLTLVVYCSSGMGGCNRLTNAVAKLVQCGHISLQNTVGDANNQINVTSPAPPIASSDNFYITLAAELVDDISLRHTVLTNFILRRVY